MPKLPKIAEILKLRVFPAIFNRQFLAISAIWHCKSVQEYQKLPFDSALHSVYFLKFARPRPISEVKH